MATYHGNVDIPSGAAVAWSGWLNTTDQDSGASANSDPGSNLDSLVVPSAGVLRPTWTPDASRDGFDEMVRWEVSHSEGGWFDGTDRGGGKGILCIHVRKAAVINDASQDPIVAVGIRDPVTGNGYGVGLEYVTTTTAQASLNTQTSGGGSGTTITWEDYLGFFIPAVVKDSPATPANTSQLVGYVFGSEASQEVPNATAPRNFAHTIPQGFLADPTSWQFWWGVGQELSTPTQMVTDVQIRHAWMCRPDITD